MNFQVDGGASGREEEEDKKKKDGERGGRKQKKGRRSGEKGWEEMEEREENLGQRDPKILVWRKRRGTQAAPAWCLTLQGQGCSISGSRPDPKYHQIHQELPNTPGGLLDIGPGGVGGHVPGAHPHGRMWCGAGDGEG